MSQIPTSAFHRTAARVARGRPRKVADTSIISRRGAEKGEKTMDSGRQSEQERRGGYVDFQSRNRAPSKQPDRPQKGGLARKVKTGLFSYRCRREAEQEHAYLKYLDPARSQEYQAKATRCFCYS